MALALQQIVVVSNLEVFGTYGFRNYHNMLLDQAFGNYREVLRKVILSPVMGDYLNNANNDKSAPNENFARELLQLFSVGTCELNPDGTLKGGTCSATYDNDQVREYAYALTGWTYPAGGATPWGCWPQGSNCQYYGGDMVPLAASHDSQARTLLGGAEPGRRTHRPGGAGGRARQHHEPPQHRAFRGQAADPAPGQQQPVALAYVQRVADAFVTGRHAGFGTGQRGDMKATVAAILLDPEARSSSPGQSAGRLREPVQLFTGVLRALNGRTDGDALGWWWGEELRQHMFRSPSVFNFYSPTFPVAGTSLVGPAFGLHSTNAALQRVNFVNYLVFWDGSAPSASVPSALGTKVSLSAFTTDAEDPAATGRPPLVAGLGPAAAHQRAHHGHQRGGGGHPVHQRRQIPDRPGETGGLPGVLVAAIPDRPLSHR